METGVWGKQCTQKHSRRRSKQSVPPSEPNNKTIVVWEQAIEKAYKGEMEQDESEIGTWEKQKIRCPRRSFNKRACPWTPMNPVDLGFARIALEFYQHKNGGDFEIIEVDFVKHMKEDSFEKGLGPQGTNLWCHVGFIAEHRQANCSTDVSLKGFFGELKSYDADAKFIATYCSTEEYDRSREIYRNGQCMFCPHSVTPWHPIKCDYACHWGYDATVDSD